MCAGCHVYAGVDMFAPMTKTCLRERKHGTQSPESLLPTRRAAAQRRVMTRMLSAQKGAAKSQAYSRSIGRIEITNLDTQGFGDLLQCLP